jgi:hypothetical protein
LVYFCPFDVRNSQKFNQIREKKGKKDNYFTILHLYSKKFLTFAPEIRPTIKKNEPTEGCNSRKSGAGTG